MSEVAEDFEERVRWLVARVRTPIWNEPLGAWVCRACAEPHGAHDAKCPLVEVCEVLGMSPTDPTHSTSMSLCPKCGNRDVHADEHVLWCADENCRNRIA